MKRKHFSFILIALVALMATSAIRTFAQGGFVVFKVVDASDKEPIIGAPVKIMGSSKATVTNAYGVATLKDVKQKDIYMVSYVGYKTKVDTIGCGTNFQVELVEDLAESED